MLSKFIWPTNSAPVVEITEEFGMDSSHDKFDPDSSQGMFAAPGKITDSAWVLGRELGAKGKARTKAAEITEGNWVDKIRFGKEIFLQGCKDL
jgi:hypothetical protein